MGHPTMQENDTAKLTPTIIFYKCNKPCITAWIILLFYCIRFKFY